MTWNKRRDICLLVEYYPPSVPLCHVKNGTPNPQKCAKHIYSTADELGILTVDYSLRSIYNQNVNFNTAAVTVKSTLPAKRCFLPLQGLNPKKLLQIRCWFDRSFSTTWNICRRASTRSPDFGLPRAQPKHPQMLPTTNKDTE